MRQRKQERHVHDLAALLQIAAKRIKTSRDYRLPAISWTKEYCISRFGEYLYSMNHIFVSRLLDTAEVSAEEIIAVICHELQHQECRDEKSVAKALQDLPGYQANIQKLNEFMTKIYSVEAVVGNRQVKTNGTVLFCLMPQAAIDEAYTFYNRCMCIRPQQTVHEAAGLEKKSFPLVILVAIQEDYLWLLGWMKACRFYSKPQKVSHEVFGGIDFTYQLKCLQEDFYRLPGGCFLGVVDKNDQTAFPAIGAFIKSLAAKGFAVLSDTDPIANKFLDEIKNYPCEFEIMGMPAAQIYIASPILADEPRRIIAKAKKVAAVSGFTYLWLANRAVELEYSYETLLNQAQALHYVSFIDDALTCYQKVLAIKPQSHEAMLGCLQALIMLGRKEDAILLAAKMLNARQRRHAAAWEKDFRFCLQHLQLKNIACNSTGGT